MRRTLLQAAAMLGIAFMAAAISNAVRPALHWRGDDLDLLRHKVPRITVEEAARAHATATTLFLDIRGASEFARGHIAGAVEFGGADLQSAYDELRDFLGPEIEVIVYGDEILGAVRAAEFLGARGHSAKVLEGGWRGWSERHLPVETAVTP